MPCMQAVSDAMHAVSDALHTQEGINENGYNIFFHVSNKQININYQLNTILFQKLKSELFNLQKIENG